MQAWWMALRECARSILKAATIANSQNVNAGTAEWTTGLRKWTNEIRKCGAAAESAARYDLRTGNGTNQSRHSCMRDGGSRI